MSAAKPMQPSGLQFYRSFSAEHWLLFTIVLVMLPHLFYQPIEIGISCLLLIAWRVAYLYKLVKLPTRMILTTLSIFAFAGIIFKFRTIFGRDAGVALLLVMTCLKLLEMKQWRDTAIAICLGYFSAATAFLYNQNIIMGAYAILIIYLLCMSSINYTIPKHNNHFQLTSFRLASNLLLQSLPLAAILFLLFPRISAPLWQFPNDSEQALSGLSDTMTPGNISKLTLDESVAFRVQFDTPIPRSDEFYWRGPVLSEFDGRSWRRTHRVRNFNISGSLQYQKMIRRLRAEKALQSDYNLIIEANSKKWLFSLDVPIRIPGDADFTKQFEIIAKNKINKAKRYHISSLSSDSINLEQAVNLSHFLELPSNTAPRARQFIKTLKSSSLSSEQNESAIVSTLLNYFKQQDFYYTQQPPLLGDAPVDEFLFETREGFCEHYASAFAVLMRLAGIPSRVVTGYLGGDINPYGNYLIVTQADAHAWTEIWLHNRGWVRIDPTAMIPPERIRQESFQARNEMGSRRIIHSANWLGGVMNQFRYAWDSVNHAWLTWFISYDSKKQLSLLENIGLPNISARAVIMILFALLTVVISVIGYFLLYKKPSRKNQHRRVQTLYLRFCEKFKRRGLIRTPSESATEFANRIIDSFPQLRPSVIEITQLYNSIRYSNKHIPSDMTKFEAAVKHFSLRGL